MVRGSSLLPQLAQILERYYYDECITDYVGDLIHEQSLLNTVENCWLGHLLVLVRQPVTREVSVCWLVLGVFTHNSCRGVARISVL